MKIIANDVHSFSRQQLSSVQDVVKISDIDPKATCFWIDSENETEVYNTIKSIRENTSLSLLPVFIKNTTNKLSHCISDGNCKNEDDVLEQSSDIISLLDSLPNDIIVQNADKQNLRLLNYLYTRPNKQLEPVLSFHHKMVYHYPLLECFADRGEDLNKWLDNLKSQRMLEQVAIIDRTRHCTQCYSGHLNYIDICPKCHEIDIETKKFIHCFSCGNVDQEQRFMHGGSLRCFTCNTKLKHIGADYDRPLESFQCNSCNHRFADPKVLARCMQCSTASSPDELAINNVCSYKLTERGRMVVRGQFNVNSIYIKDSTFVNEDVFHHMLNWQLSLSKKMPANNFTLLGIRIEDINLTSGFNAGMPSLKTVDLFITMICENLREIDTATRENQNTIWILIPDAQNNATADFLQKIKALEKQMENSNGITLRVKHLALSMPQGIVNDEDTNELMLRLAMKLAR